MTRCATQTWAIIQLMRDFKIDLKRIFHADLGIVSHVGLGSTGHIQVQFVWLRERLLSDVLKAIKVDGKYNCV